MDRWRRKAPTTDKRVSHATAAAGFGTMRCMLRITTRAVLDAWLADREGFEDGHVAGIERTPGRVSLRLEEYVGQGRRPGDVSTVDVWELVAEDPAEFVAPPSATPDHVIEGVDTGEAGGRILVEAWVPEPLRLVADAVTVVRLGRQERVVEPWVRDTEFAAMTPTPPTSRFWTDQVEAALGTPVVWRILGGTSPKQADQDYDGCFLQRLDKLTTTDGGVLCLWGRTQVTFRWDGADQALWDAVRLGAAGLDGVRTGNCAMSPADWTRYLSRGLLPPPNRLRA